MIGQRWREEALCWQSGTDFTTERSHGGTGPDQYHERSVEDAMATCAVCPVSEPCLRFALAMEHGVGLPFRVGVWGGTAPGERWLMDHPDQHGTPQAVKAGCRCERCERRAA